MSLADFATELINDAKTCSEAEETVFKLEQLKEVVLHRDVSLLPEVFPGAVELMTRSSVKIKKFLVKFASEAIVKSPAIIIDFISLYSFFLEDAQDVIRRAVVIQLSRVYDKAAMAVVNMTSDKGRAATATVLATWESLQMLVAKCTELISTVPADSPGSDQIRTEILKLVEAVVYFGFPASKHGDSGATSAVQYHKNTVADIPLKHPHVNRDTLEKETEGLYSKLVLWLTRGGSSSGASGVVHFTPSLLFVLASMVAKIAIDRPSAPRMLSAVKALTVYISGVNKSVGSGAVESIDLVGRDNISRSIRRLLSAAAAGASAADHADYSKLSSVMDSFDAETQGRNTAAVVSDPRKRGRGAVKPKPAPIPLVQTSTAVVEAQLETEDIDVSEQVRQSALEAVDQMEAKLKQKASLVAATASSAVIATGALTADASDSVEFGWDILRDSSGGSVIPTQDLTQNKLVSLQMQQKSEITLKTVPMMINVVENQYQNIALFNMENYISQLVNLKLPRASANAAAAAALAALSAAPEEETDESGGGHVVSEEESKIRHLMSAMCIKLSLSLCEVVALGLKSGNAEMTNEALVALRSKNSKMFVSLCIYALPGSMSSQFLEIPFSSFRSSAVVTRGAGHVGSDDTNEFVFLASLFKQVPGSVDLPKPLWLLISMFLAQAESVTHSFYVQATAAAEIAAATATTYKQRQAAIEAQKITIADAATLGDGSVMNWINVLLQLMLMVFHREEHWRSFLRDQGIDSDSSDSTDGASSALLYDNVCLLILSRLLQRRALRSLAAYFVESLPLVPLCCVRYLNMVLYMGGRLYASDHNTRDKTVRQEACNILGKLVTSYYEFTLTLERLKQREERMPEHEDNYESEQSHSTESPLPPGVSKEQCEEVIRVALYSLLWCSISSAEIDVRSTAISTLTANVVPFLSATSWVLRSVYVFSIQAAIGVIGASKLRSRVFKQPSQVPPPPEEESGWGEGEGEGEGMELDESVPVPATTKAVTKSNSVTANVKVTSPETEYEASGSAVASVLLLGTEEEEEEQDEPLAVDGTENPEKEGEGEGEEKEQDEYVYEGPELHFSSLLFESLDSFDMGLSFAAGGGPFAPLYMDNLLASTLPETELLAAVETYTRIHINMLFQLCLTDMNMLFPVVNLYGCLVYLRQQLLFELKNMDVASSNSVESEKTKKPMELQIKIMDIMLNCTVTVFESTIHAVMQKHRQAVAPASVATTAVANVAAMDIDDAAATTDVEPEVQLSVMETFLRDIMQNTDVYAYIMVFSILDTVYAVDTPAVGVKKPDTVVSEHVVRFAEAYVKRVQANMTPADLKAETGEKGEYDEEVDEEDLLARKRQRISNRLLLLPSLVEGSSLSSSVATVAPSSTEYPDANDLSLSMGLFKTKFQSALLNGYSREQLETTILPNIIRYFPPATKTATAAAAAAATTDATSTATAPEPKTVSSFYPADSVKRAFIKLIRFKGSPPNVLPATAGPMSKVQLLVFLHQFDYEGYNARVIKEEGATTPIIKFAVILECINICLDQLKEDYTADSINQVLRQLIAVEQEEGQVSVDPTTLVTPPILMRTAILTATKYDECKRFVFSQIIPALIRRQTWRTAPKIWDGVAFFVKKFAVTTGSQTAVQKDVEITLRSLLGMPSEQLSRIIESCAVTVPNNARNATSKMTVINDLKRSLKKLLGNLSSDEKAEVLSGVWAGLVTPTCTSTATATDSAKEEKAKEEEDVGNAAVVTEEAAAKAKLVESIVKST